MPAFVPGYEYDVFVSYARANNQQGWVGEFKSQLEIRLNEKLGRIGLARIFFDTTAIPGNQPLTDTIRDAVTKTATLVIVLSPAYLASDWCRQEREHFIRACGGADSAAGRIFLAHYDEVEINDKPTEIRDLIGYRFFEKNPENGIPQPVKPDHATYNAEIYRLRLQLAEQLRRMVTAPEPSPVEPARCVFLAETTPDLAEAYKEVDVALKQARICVVPGTYFFHAPEGFEEEIDRHLDKSLLFVQLLGSFRYPPTDAFPDGYEKWLLDRAKAKGKPVMQWRSRELKLDSIPDPKHRRFVDGDDVIAEDLETFKSMISQEVDDLLIKQKSKAAGKLPQAETPKYVLLNANASDAAVAEEIGEQLLRSNIGYEIETNGMPLAKATASVQYDGVLLFYGRCQQDWVQTRVRDFRDVLVREKSGAPVGAVYIAPPDEKQPLRARLPQLLVIDHHDPAALGAFIEKLAGRETAP